MRTARRGWRGVRLKGRKSRGRELRTRTSRYTGFVLKNVTVTLEEDALKWARHQAAEEGLSVSKLLGKILEREMRNRGAEYRQAFEDWKRLTAQGFDIDATNRLTREEAHERR